MNNQGSKDLPVQMPHVQVEAVLEHAVEAYRPEPGPDQSRVVAIHPKEAQIVGGYPAVAGISVGQRVVELAGAELGIRYFTRGIPEMRVSMAVDRRRSSGLEHFSVTCLRARDRGSPNRERPGCRGSIPL